MKYLVSELNCNSSTVLIVQCTAMEKECVDYSEAIRKLEEKVRSLKRSNEVYIREQKLLKQKIASLKDQEDLTRRKIQEDADELRQQIADMEFYARSQDHIAKAVGQDEIDSTQLIICEPPRSAFPGKTSKKASRKK